MTGIGFFRIRWDEETGALEREGTSTAKGSKVVAHSDKLVAVKIAGSHYYGGQGQRFNYSPAKFAVYEIVREDGDGWLLVRKAELSWPVRGA